MRLLLHTCCGPCLIEPLDALGDEHEVTAHYANPNIQPLEEFERRREALRDYARQVGVPVVEADHQPEMWSSAVDATLSPPERCRQCYRVRLGMTARIAADLGYDAIGTTLTVSPYQDVDAIHEAGEEAARLAGVRYLRTDFRGRYAAATRRSRELGLYRQNYCGCEPSRLEAEADRAERRAARKRVQATMRGAAS